MFCTKCGHQLSDDARFCPSCGQKVEKEAALAGENEAVVSVEGVEVNSAAETTESGIVEETTESVVVDETAESAESSPVDVNTDSESVSKVNEEAKVEEAPVTESVEGEKTENESAETTGSSYAEDKEGTESSNEKKTFNWKDYFTWDNLERYGSVAALFPIAMFVLVGIIGGILFNTIGLFKAGNAVCKFLAFVFKAIFIVSTFGITAGLGYIVVTKKDKSSVNSWVAPAGTLAAGISCIGIACGSNAVAWIFGIIAVVFGLELFARIVIGKQPMDSPANPGGAVATYKKFYEDYKEKYGSVKDKKAEANNADPVATGESRFDGNGVELLGYTVLTVLVSAVTCGLGAPWMVCKLYEWKINHTVIDGKKLKFNGSGASLFGHWILWMILTTITCGIYGFFMHVALRKWELEHTYIEGEAVSIDEKNSFFDGNSMEFIGYDIVGGILISFTCGLAYPFVMAMLAKWDTSHCVVNKRRMVFDGNGLAFLGEYLLIFVLSIITLGIYSPWGTVRIYKYITNHTHFVD